jgi:succinate-acetate transporter protein
MKQPPFPFALVALVVFFVFVAFTSDTAWISVVAGVGALFVAAAAIYQSMPQRIVGEEMDDPLDGIEPPT